MPYWRGKSILHLGVRWIMLATAVQFAFYAHPLFANPAGASVVNGAVNMQTSGNTLAITASDRSIINWQGFSIGAGETTQFIQPNAGASVLNRVTSGDASQIMGALQANGQVYLINPNGVFIGNGATINVGSFLASTANVSDESFMRGGNLTFSEASGAGIINRGTITANHGDVFLLAKTVENSGTIQAAQGTVGLMAGTQFFLKKDETGAVKVKVDSSSVAGMKAGTGVANSGVIEAMQAQLEAQGNVYALAINQSGIIRATGVSRDASGTIVLSAPGGMIRNTGTMLALNRDGSGGRLSLSGGDIMTEVSSIMTAAGTGVSELAMGGQIEISAEKDAIVSGRLDVSAGDGAKGGRLVVTGERVGLFDGKVNASGGTGGGEVLLGGDYQGVNPLVRNAEAMVMTSDSSITADATVAGDGGRVILWSNEYTGFFGDISAKGGVVSGNGGFVETSSKDNLQAFGLVTASAFNGQGGEWLLDPYNLTISTSATSNAGSSPNFVAAANDAVVQSGPTASAGSISAGLSAGTSITVSTGNVAGSQAGNITVTGAIGKTAGTAATLTLNANGSIDIQTGGAISSTTGTLGLTLNAGFANGGDSTVVSASSVTIGDTIGLNGGNLTINNVGTGSITLNANIGGATTAAVVTANLTSGGAITQTSGVFTATGTTTLAAGSGQAITLSTGGTPNNFGTVVVNSGGAVTLSEADAITFGAVTASGNFNLTSGGAATFNNPVNLGQTGGSFNATTTGVTSAANVNNTITANGVTISSTGVLTIGPLGTITSGGAVSLNGSSISTGANVTTTADAVRYLADTTLTAPGIVVNSAGGDITFSGTLLGAQSLGLTAGVGNILFSGVVGGTPLTTVTINSANNVTANGAFSAASLSIPALTGSAIFNGNLNLTTGLTTTVGAYNISILGATQTIAGATAFNNTGTLTLGNGGDSITFSAGVVATAPTTKVLNGTVSGGTTGGVINLGTTVVTVSGNSTLGANSASATGAVTVGPATLADSVTLTVGTGSFAGNISLGSITGTAGGQSSNLAVTTTGSAALGGAMGTDIGSVNVSATGISLTSTITSPTDTGTAVFLNANSGNLVISANGDIITSRGDVNLDGAQIQTAADIGTVGKAITFNSPTLLTGNITLDKGTGGGTGDDITFSSTLDGGFTLGITAGTQNVIFTGTVGGSSLLGSVTINSADTTTLSSAFSAASLNVTSDTVELDGLSIDTSSGGGVVRFNGSTLLKNNLVITRGAGAVTFTQDLNSDSLEYRNLTINGAGGGNVTFSGTVGGGSQELGDILISTGTSVTMADVTAVSVDISSSSITLGGALDTQIAGAGTITLNANAGQLTIGTTASISANGDVSLTGSSGISLSGNITTTDDNININSATTLGSSVLLSNDTGGGDITFGSTLGTSLTTAPSLGLTAGGGNILFSSTVTGLAAITINSGADLTAAAISAASLVGTALTGDVSLTGAQVYTGAAGLNLVTTGGTITLANAAAVTANAGILTLNSSGVMTIGTGAISTGDVVNLTAGGVITTSANITTSNDNINFNSATSLGGPVVLNTGTGAGDITFANTLNGAQTLGLTAGTGSITFSGIVGGVTPLTTVTVNSANNLTASQAFSAASLSLPLLVGPVTPATASFLGNLNLTTGLTTTAGAYAISMIGAANTIAGTTTFNNTGAVTIGAALGSSTFSSGVVATAPSSVTIAGTVAASVGTSTITLGDANTPVTISASSIVGGAATGAITLGNATLANGVTLTIGTGIANTISLGSITGTAAGAVSNLTLNTTEAVTVTGAVGTDIGTIIITQSGGVAFQSTVTANTVTISNSTLGANVDFQDNLTVNTGMAAAGGTAAYDILITGSNNSVAGNTTFANTGELTIGDGATDVSLFTGGLTATTQSAGFGAGFVRTAGGVVDLGVVDFTAASTVDTTNDGAVAAGANLTLVGALGGQNLALIGGSAGTVVLGAGTAAVANLTVTADEINFTGGAGSIAATGDVLLQGATAATTIGVGGGAGTLDLNDTDLAAIADGATSITIGQALQTGLVTVDTSAFRDPVTIRSSGTLGEVQVDGLITATGATTSVTLQGATLDLNAGIDTAGGAVTLTGGIGGVDLAAGQDITTTAAAGTASGAVSITSAGAGTINLAGDLVTTGAVNGAGVGSAAGAITIGGANGNVSITGNISALGGASSAGAGGAGGDLSITTTTGAVSITGDISALGGASSAGAGGAGGDLSITTTTGTIGLANIDTSGGASSLNNSNGGDAGAIAINSSGGLSVTLNSSTINASGGAAGGGTGLAGDGANITFDNPVILAGASTITTTGDTGGDIEFNDTVSGTFDLTLASGNGNITFADDVGSDVLDPLGIVTVNSVNTFLSSSTFEADEFVLAAAPLTSVTFSGGLNLSTGLTTIAGSYGFSITGASNSIAGGTNFLNQGALVIGDDSLDELTFVGGLATTGNVTNPSSVSLAGTISTTDTPMDLGAVTLTAATILDTGNSAVGVLNVGAVTSGGNSLTLDSGSTAGATIGLTSMANLAGGLTIRDAGGLATIGALGSGTAGALTITDSTSGVTFSSTVNATSVTISDSTAGATISFLGNLTATSMTAAGTANAYNISITGAANTITGATTFANTGTLTLGNGGDAIAFTGGVTATAPSTINLNGNITAAGTGVINLGAAAVAVGGSSTVGGTSTGAITVGNATAADGVTLTVGTGIANAITLGTVTGTAAGTVSNLTVNTTGVVTVGAIGTDIGTVTLTQSGGATFAAVSAANVVVTDTADNTTVSFGGNLNVTTGMTIGANGAYNVAITGANNTIAGTTTFANIGTVTIGDNAADSTTFSSGVVVTAPSAVTIAGTVAASVGTSTITLGDSNTPVSVSASATVGGAATGAITLGNATLANGVTLTIGTGIANTISLGSITGTAAGAVSDLTLSTTGAVTAAGAVGTDIGTITITQSGGVAFQSTVTANTVTISDSTVGADVAFQGNLTANTAMTVAAGTAAYDILITGSSNSIAGNTTFNNGGSLTIGNSATDITVFTGGLTATTPSAGFGAGFVRTAGGVVNLGTVTFTAATTIDTTNNGGVPAGANLTLAGALGGQNLALIGGSAGTVVLGAGTAAVANLTVTADEINFTGGAGSIAATGAVLLQGATAGTTIGVGGGAGTLDISDADLAAIADGATSITIGQSAQTGLITVGTSSFRDSVLIRSSGTLGEVQVDGLISATGATTSVTLQGATLDLNAGIDTAGGAVTLTGGIGGVDLAVAQTINTAAAANSGTASGAVAITATGVGTINLSGDLVTTGAANSLGVGSAGGAVAITSTTGTIALANISTSGGASTLANNNGGNAGTVGISSTGGSVVTLNASTITASGGVGGGGVIGVAGNGSAITFDNPVLLATGSSSIVTTGTVGGNVSFNNTLNGAQSLTVNAGTGTVTLAGSVGNTAGLTNLDITAALIRLNAAIMNLDSWAGVVNTSTFTGPVTLGANVSLDMAGALGNNNLVFTSTVDSDLTPRSLTILAGASGDVVVGEGGVTLTGAVGGTRALSAIGVTAQVLSVADVTTSGAISVTADGIAPTGIITSTAAGDITIRPLTAGTAIGIGTGVVSGGLDLGSGLADVFTSGRVIIGSTASTGSGSGVITIGTVDLSATGYTGFSLLSQNATATFNADSVLTLPTGTDIRFQLGTGDVNGRDELNSTSSSPNLVSAGGTLRFVTVGSVSLYGSVDNLQTSASSGVSGGLVYLNEGTLNVIGSQTAAGQMLIGSVNGDLNLSSQLTGTKITAYAAQNFNNTFGSTAINLQGGRGLVYSTSPNDNTPNTANGGLTGFGAAYLVPSPKVDFNGGVGTYTILNPPAGSANLMAYSDPLPVSQLDAVTLNQIVQTEAYLAAVPLTGATLPALPRSDVRLGFRAGAPQQRAPVINPLGKVEKGSDTKGQSADVATPGRLKVSQVKRAGEDKGAGETVRTEPRVQPVIRIGAVTLRPSGDYLPFELAEVTMGGIRISQK